MATRSPSQLPVTDRAFTQRFSATPRGARLARLLAVQQLDGWGFPYGTRLSETVAVVVAELAANAATHGRVAGRDFALTLALLGAAQTVRVEVADTRTEVWPSATPPPAAPDAECGRGLLLVDALADRWGVTPRADGPGKVVWAELRSCRPSGPMTSFSCS
jgi:anti-sigma regulatory factor (Ser/Thr protein kinase)